MPSLFGTQRAEIKYLVFQARTAPAERLTLGSNYRYQNNKIEGEGPHFRLDALDEIDRVTIPCQMPHYRIKMKKRLYPWPSSRLDLGVHQPDARLANVPPVLSQYS